MEDLKRKKRSKERGERRVKGEQSGGRTKRKVGRSMEEFGDDATFRFPIK